MGRALNGEMGRALNGDMGEGVGILLSGQDRGEPQAMGRDFGEVIERTRLV